MTNQIKNRLIDFFFNLEDWQIFTKKLLSIIVFIVLLLILWVFPISLFVAPFYSITQDEPHKVKIYKETEGKTTVLSIADGIDKILDTGLTTNFFGVKTWIDNKYYQQVGEIEIYRLSVWSLENSLGRNRGTGGANKSLVQARSDIYADYNLPIFTSFNKRLKQTVKNLHKYINKLEQDASLPMDKKQAVFIVNSDNLAEVIDRLKQQLQTNIMVKTRFFTTDDKFYTIKGNLIALHQFLEGIKFDFADKLKDKSSYEENFIPLLSQIKKTIQQNPIVIMESLGHLSKLSNEANVIAQKLGELRDKLKKG
ncbi:MAG: hypothetical protein DRQ51_00020 [Gammaproteobacteria bacterium]|nr:MAG: hypothetical protein DRQ51_00020 [Gammaproteobacteria bacterium]